MERFLPVKAVITRPLLLCRGMYYHFVNHFFGEVIVELFKYSGTIQFRLQVSCNQVVLIADFHHQHFIWW
jgi:hypothetical protein